jgi:DNA-nicking Smr family endonuclease
MKPRKSSFSFKSFQDLKVLIDSKSFSFPDHHPPNLKGYKKGLDQESEEELFKNAMEGVIPIPKDNYVERSFKKRIPEGDQNKEGVEILKKLKNLVEYGEGFHISDTPEYIEGTGYHVHPEIAKRLHRGDYSIQAYIDLHGLIVEDAKEVLEKFLKWAVTTGKQGVLIVHGRGLSSPSEPVLKRMVVEWLTRSPWRKWVVAYSSARICDGGAGATYVLLRQRPISKRLKVRKTASEK